MRQWQWLHEAIVIALHEEQLAEHGGPIGIRDHGLIQTALARPLQLASYGDPAPDLADLAAAYGYGLARLHPFMDGNKRTALVATETFIALQGRSLDASNAECVVVFVALAADELSEQDFARWLRDRLRS